MCAGDDPDTRASELGAQLVEAPSGDALFRTVDEECGDWRVVGRLLSEVGDLDELVARGARGAARGCRVGGMFDRR